VICATHAAEKLCVSGIAKNFFAHSHGEGKEGGIEIGRCSNGGQYAKVGFADDPGRRKDSKIVGKRAISQPMPQGKSASLGGGASYASGILPKNCVVWQKKTMICAQVGGRKKRLAVMQRRRFRTCRLESPKITERKNNGDIKKDHGSRRGGVSERAEDPGFWKCRNGGAVFQKKGRNRGSMSSSKRLKGVETKNTERGKIRVLESPARSARQKRGGG